MCVVCWVQGAFCAGGVRVQAPFWVRCVLGAGGSGSGLDEGFVAVQEDVDHSSEGIGLTLSFTCLAYEIFELQHDDHHLSCLSLLPICLVLPLCAL